MGTFETRRETVYSRQGAHAVESPIERDMVYTLAKRTCGELRTQVSARLAGYGAVRFDAVVTVGPRRAVFEADGRAFHRDPADYERDVATLATYAEVVYRLPGAAIHHSIDACLRVVALRDPWLFDDRVRGIIETLGWEVSDASVLDTERMILALIDPEQHPACVADECDYEACRCVRCIGPARVLRMTRRARVTTPRETSPPVSNPATSADARAARETLAALRKGPSR